LRAKRRRRKIFWRFTGALLLIAVALGAIVVLFPVRVFGVSERALEYSLERHVSGHVIEAGCVRGRASHWRCDLFDGQTSQTRAYDVQVSKKGCWTATSIGLKRAHGCLAIWDYLRLADRVV
jgi:hypothetical protein